MYSKRMKSANLDIGKLRITRNLLI